MKVYILNHYARDGVRYRLFSTQYFSTEEKRNEYYNALKKKYKFTGDDMFEEDEAELDPVVK